MSHQLPPDLSRLGDQLTAAAERRVRERRRRLAIVGRLAVTGVATALAFGILSSGPLGTAERPGDALELASATTAYVPVACDQPRGATFAAARPCGPPGATDAALILARRYAMR
jgi:hypothetical protein